MQMEDFAPICPACRVVGAAHKIATGQRGRRRKRKRGSEQVEWNHCFEQANQAVERKDLHKIHHHHHHHHHQETSDQDQPAAAMREIGHQANMSSQSAAAVETHRPSHHRRMSSTGRTSTRTSRKSATTTTTAFSRQRSRSTAAGAPSWTWNFFLLLTIAQLICDIGQPALVLTAAARQQQQQQQEQANSDSDQTFGASGGSGGGGRSPPSAFLVDPRDTLAVVGQTRRLTCVAPKQPGRLAWYVGEVVRVSDDLEVLFRKSRYSVTREPLISERQLLALRLQANESLQSGGIGGALFDSAIPTGSDQLNSSGGGEMIGQKYTLTIRNVSLADEQDFHCIFTGELEKLKSRQARLQVLEPPTRLEIRALKTGRDDEDGSGDSGGAVDDEVAEAHKTNAAAAAIDDELELFAGTDRQESATQTIQTLEVKQNAIVQLECRTNWAKPHAELTWLDENQQPVPSLTQSLALAQSLDNDTAMARGQSYTEMFVRANETTPAGLEETRLVWFFRARRDMHNKLFSCVAKHKAFALRNSHESSSNGNDENEISRTLPARSLERSVRLSVLYEPEVELTRDPLAPNEFAPVRFQCNAHARPSKLRYSWSIDDQLVVNATEPELYVASLTRQLHLREIKCQAANSIGRTANVTRLAVRYSPAYVTHLLPPSLQPDHLATRAFTTSGGPAGHLRNQLADNLESSSDLRKTSESSSSSPKTGTGNFQHLFEQLDLKIARELAVGATLNSDVNLRCDFDSNPQPASVLWFKINTEYANMRDVTPREADELIAFGANHAVFKPRAAAHAARAASNSNLDSDLKVSALGKRHISIDQTSGASAASGAPASGQADDLDEQEADNGRASLDLYEQHELDFEQMSRDLMIEMSILDAQQQQMRERAALNKTQGIPNQTQVQADSASRFIEPVGSVLPISQTIVTIEEPLEFKMAPRRPTAAAAKSRLAHARNLNSNKSVADQDDETHNLTGATQSSSSYRAASSAHSELIFVKSTQAVTAGHHQPGRLNGQQAALAQRHRNRNRLSGRQAQLTSSSVELRRVNADSIGRYVCHARAAPNFNSTSKSVYLVLQQRPRIISVDRQFAPLGARQMQVECLVQINTVLDNQTRITWSRDGKTIDVMYRFPGAAPSEKNVTIIEELSPDALFIRSTLRISGAAMADFGTYTCRVINSFEEPDELTIHLNPSTPTSATLRLLATFGLVTVLLFGTIFCCIYTLDPCKPFDKSLKATVGKQTIKSDKTSISIDVTDSGGRNARKLGGSGATNSMLSSNDSSVDFHVDEHKSPGAQLALQRPSSAFSPPTGHQGGGNGGGGGAHFEGGANFRRQHSQQFSPRACSLRAPSQQRGQPRNFRLDSNGQPVCSTKFAAIHESLEHKLQFAQPNGEQQQQHQRHSSSSSASTNSSATQFQHNNNADADDRGQAMAQQHANQLANQDGNKPSLLERLRSRFSSSGGAGVEGSNRKRRRFVAAPGKRPVISMPLASGAKLKRTNLSNSLDLASGGGGCDGGDLNAPSAMPPGRGGKQLMMMHLNHIGSGGGGGAESHLVSSSANLIQDSTTASDTTATSSGRSSSTSQHRVNQQHGPPPVGPRPQHYLAPLGWPAGANCDTAQASHLYVNRAASAYCAQPNEMTVMVDTSQQQQQQQQVYQQNQIYANEQLHFDGAGQPVDLTAYSQPPSVWPLQQAQHEQNLYTCGQLQPQQPQSHQNSAQMEPTPHYQMPMLMSEPYLAAAVAQAVAKQQQQQNNLAAQHDNAQMNTERTDYATICNKSLNSGGGGGGVANKFSNHNHEEMTNGAVYSHHQHQNHQIHHRSAGPVMVPTSDIGEAYFESNYGTLLSRSSAYKTLGYTTSHPMHSTDSAGSSSSTSTSSGATGSSSPANSLTTHANFVAPSAAIATSLATLPADGGVGDLSTPQHQQQQQPMFQPQQVQFYQTVASELGRGVDSTNVAADNGDQRATTNMTNDSAGLEVESLASALKARGGQPNSIKSSDLATHV